MKKPPIVTIVGRQNVGKSTLYNRLAGKSGRSITEDTPGVTRDVLETRVEREELECPILLRDTPGLDIENLDEMNRSILEVSFAHLQESDLIIHVIDRKDVRDYDFQLLERFRKDPKISTIPILFVANKVDSEKDEIDMEELYRIGITEPVPVSALGKRNIGLVFDKINFMLPNKGRAENIQVDLKLSIVGKPNSGKSSLLNAILGYKRAVVSEIAGTTRDSLNAYFQYKERLAEITDTAGIRKKSRTAESLEFYSYKRTLKAMEEANIVVFLLDATKGVGEYDKKIFAYLEKTGKPVVIVFNKWDLIPDKTDKTLKEFRENVIGRFPAMKNKPMLTASAVTRQRVSQVLDRVWAMHDKTKIRITTGELNRKIKEWLADGRVNQVSKRPLKVKYATQISSLPFHVVFFVNSRELFTPNILSFFKKKFDTDYDLGGIPVRIEIRDNETKK
ncbi:MAG: ribosome biogenesis GTPase Der [Leptospira sp.]|nr:ribosome biogenesis GTPase Der [Leptospira sp.]